MRLELIIYLSLSMILTFIPLPEMLHGCWPNWIVLFFFWLNHFRASTSHYIWVWGIGLMLDVLQATHLGVHVIALLVLNFLLQTYRYKFLLFPNIQQCILVFLGTGTYLFFAQFFSFDLSWWHFILYAIQVSMVTAMLWPWVEFYNRSRADLPRI